MTFTSKRRPSAQVPISEWRGLLLQESTKKHERKVAATGALPAVIVLTIKGGSAW